LNLLAKGRAEGYFFEVLPKPITLKVLLEKAPELRTAGSPASRFLNSLPGMFSLPDLGCSLCVL